MHEQNELREENKELEIAQVAIFSTLSGVTHGWRKEYDQWGAIALWERMKDGLYQEQTHGTPLGDRIKEFNYERIKNEVEKNRSQFLFPHHPHWPTVINDASPAPIGLIVQGDLAILQSLKSSLAVVGTRNPTRYGERIASEFCSSLAEREWISVSGGAMGIDAAAHRGSLLSEGGTIAVLASAINDPYPQIHTQLFEHISQSGLVITETPIGQPTVPARFLHRNRLIAALARATLVVEAPYRSGALRTAKNANEYLRPVFGIPGPITSPASEGVHQLIIERQAELVVSVNDLISLLT